MHDDRAEHGRRHFEPGEQPPDTYEEIQGLEQHSLTSVGIDIGSSTSQVVAARLTIRRRGSDLSTEFVVTDREVLYVSAPLLTPYSSGTKMDVGLLERFVQACYVEADLVPERVDTGVVVVTGEALNKENAAEIAKVVSRWSGNFICVSAGANHEAVLAAHGSGSVALSELHDCTVLNVDVGGGTTKVSLIDRGKIVSREAFSVGARLVAWDLDDRLVRLEEPALIHAVHAGVALRLGHQVTADDLDRLAELMARVVLDAIIPGPLAQLRRDLMVTEVSEVPAEWNPIADRIVFSGGVSEYINGREAQSFGDLGPLLGEHVRRHLDRAGLGHLVTPAENGIRATVIGASEFSMQASGQTCYISDESLLPVRSLPVAQLEFSPDGDTDQAIVSALRHHDRNDLGEPLALAVHFRGTRDYRRLLGYADALVRAAKDDPLYLVLRDDLALSLGRMIVAELGHAGPLVVVDGITVGDLDYLDIGHPMGATKSIPVTVKSLAFPG